MSARHAMTSIEQVGGLWEWTCYCGEESTGHEDRDAADSVYEEHLNIDRYRECTCYAPDDAEPEDHDEDCPENPGTEES